MPLYSVVSGASELLDEAGLDDAAELTMSLREDAPDEDAPDEDGCELAAELAAELTAELAADNTQLLCEWPDDTAQTTCCTHPVLNTNSRHSAKITACLQNFVCILVPPFPYYMGTA